MALLTRVSFGARFSRNPHQTLGARFPRQSSLSLLSWVARGSFGSRRAWDSHVSRTPRGTHGARKSRRTHGPWGAWRTWGPSGSLGPVAAHLSEGIRQQWIPMQRDLAIGWPYRGWRPWGSRWTWRPWRSHLSRGACSSCLARASWGSLWAWRASNPHWALAVGASLGACGPRKPPRIKSILQASISRAAPGSRGAPEQGRVLRGGWD